METALFVNFTNRDFTGFWDGKPKLIKAGQCIYMPDYLAKHFAKHLVNRELINAKKETLTSPKRPEEVPEYMELFNKAYIPDEDKEKTITQKEDDIDVQIEVANKNKELKKEADKKPDSSQPQTILSPDFDEEEKPEDKPEEGEAEEFETKPIEEKPKE